MKLTRFQYSTLRRYRRCHVSGYTPSQVLRTCWVQWVLLAVSAALSYFFVVPVSGTFGWLYVGVCVGAVMRDIGYYQVSFRMWPVTQEVYDWRRVSEIIEQHEKERA